MNYGGTWLREIRGGVGIRSKMMILLVRRNAEARLLMVSIVEVGLDKHVKKLCKEILKYLMLKLKLLYRSG